MFDPELAPDECLVLAQKYWFELPTLSMTQSECYALEKTSESFFETGRVDNLKNCVISLEKESCHIFEYFRFVIFNHLINHFICLTQIVSELFTCYILNP